MITFLWCVLATVGAAGVGVGLIFVLLVLAFHMTRNTEPKSDH